MWQNVSAFAWHDGLLPLTLLTVAVGLLMLRFKPVDRRSVIYTLLLFATGLAGVFLSGLVAHLEFRRLADWLLAVFLIIEGLAAIRLYGMFLFRLLLPRIGLHSPRILEDLMVFIAYLGLGFIQLHGAGLDLSGIVTTSAIITAVIAFSMQDTLGNILGGMALQLDNSVEIGDWIKVDEVSGKVVDIRWRHTAVETRNWETVIVPNSLLMKSKFSVLGRHGEDPVQWRRWVWFNVGYQTAPSHVIDTVQQELAEASISNIAEHPPANCILMDFDASFGRYAVRYWLNDLMADDATDSAVRDHIFAALQRHGIRLAFPEYNVHTIKESEKHQQARHFHRVQERIGVLQKIELFNGFREDELLDIAQKLKYAPFATGDIITHQGEASHWLYILTEGEVEVYLETSQQQRRKLSTLQAGSYFGEMGMMTGSPRTASVIASRDCECYLLDKDAFEQVLHNRPELAEEISQTLVSRRFGLDSLRHEVDDGMRALEMARQHQDMTSRIRHFFGLRDNT